MLKFHESETCEGIIQHLELRENARRRDVHVRDEGNHTSPDARVEMTFWLGDQFYAIEHTGIEPFDGFMEHQNRAPALFRPLEAEITAALAPVLTSGVMIEMYLPVDAFNGRKMAEVRTIHAGLVNWARITAPTLPVGGHYQGQPVSAQPVGVPFSVSLVRFDGFTFPRPFQLRHITPGDEEARILRVQRACEKKFPKLAIWRQSDNARTILILESNDVQLTNAPKVTDAFLPIAKARPDAPDETYMVATCMSPWWAWPVLIDGHSYFDLTAAGHAPHFEMDATGRLAPDARPMLP
jgi:hypothetical protein